MSNKEKKKGNPKFFKIYGMQSANFQDSGSYDKRRAQLSKKKNPWYAKIFLHTPSEKRTKDGMMEDKYGRLDSCDPILPGNAH